MPNHASGSFCWVDLGTSDADGAEAFYGAVMGWSRTEPGPVEETGGYTMFMHGDKEAAGLMEATEQGQPTAWASYVSVADADETADRVREAGGSVLVEPMDLTDVGRMAIFADPGGAVFGVWQPRTFEGAGVVNEPGGFCWNELRTSDLDGAKSFYGSVFGWSTAKPPIEDVPDDYLVWNRTDDQMVGGAMGMAELPDGTPPHWGVCFAVADCEGAASRARSAGGQVTMEPFDSSLGRFAGLIDPQGGHFTILEPAT